MLVSVGKNSSVREKGVKHRADGFWSKRNPTTSPGWVGEEGDSITPAGAGKEGGSPQVTAQRTWGVAFVFWPFLALSPTVFFQLKDLDRKKTSGFTHHKRKRVLGPKHSPSGAAFASRVPPSFLSSFG